jgi:hypothetical protein
MKKNFILTLCFLLISLVTFAGKFILIPVTEANNVESLFNNNDLKIHYYCDDYVLATADVAHYNNIVVLDENAFADVPSYAIVYCYNNQKEEYLSTLSKSNKVLYSGDHFFIMKILSNDFRPAKNDGMITIRNTEAQMPKSRFDFPVITEENEIVRGYISEVEQDSTMVYIQTLENFFTRRCDHANSILAQDWIKRKFESLDLNAFVHTLTPPVHPWWGGTCQSGNVIAIQQGTEYPDEYIVCGCHFDSFAYQSSQGEPGADDNATGTAGILETARILSQHKFKRSIIYCSFTAEECGLDGSARYALQCKNEGMNIIGYFNIDMSGYLQSGSDIHIDLIHPTSATPLANYYKNITTIYFPGLPVTSYPNLPGGDSDHTSFNQNGYMGIFPFEDSNNHSPYIHTPNDKIGPSVNTPEQVKIFTQANVASIATLAIPVDSITPPPPPPIVPPANCVARYVEDEGIKITWDAPDPELNIPDKYYVYKDESQIFETVELLYLDNTIEDYDLHCYKVTAVYNVEDEWVESEFSNADCDSIPFIDNIIEYNSNYKIYPNPTKGELRILVNNEQLIMNNVEVFDVYGRNVLSHTAHQTPYTAIDVSHLPAGIYIIKIGKEFIGKFVKE